MAIAHRCMSYGHLSITTCKCRSMLEAALQGDLSTLPSLTEDTDPVSAHVGALGQSNTAAAGIASGMEQGMDQADDRSPSELKSNHPHHRRRGPN